jgi:hypothetical protein
VSAAEDDLQRARERRRRLDEQRKLSTGLYVTATYDAKSFNVSWEGEVFSIAGTQCGHVDFATPASGTYPLTLDEVDAMITALTSAAADVRANCREGGQ